MPSAPQRRAQEEGLAWETFGRVGNSEVGEAFTRVGNPAQSVRIDNAGTYIYIGHAIPGASETDAVWQISRITGATGDKYWAGGNPYYSNKWSERVTPITYS